MQPNNNKAMPTGRQAFTLLELLMSIGLISLIAAFSLGINLRYQIDNNLDTAVNTIVQSMRRAQILSQAVDRDTTWGVKTETGIITLFNSSTSDYDETFEVPSNITFSYSPAGMNNVVFAKMTGYPATTGTITLTGPNTNETRTIIINARGMIEY